MPSQPAVVAGRWWNSGHGLSVAEPMGFADPGKLLVASRHVSARLYAEHMPFPRLKLDEQPVYKIITRAYERDVLRRVG